MINDTDTIPIPMITCCLSKLANDLFWVQATNSCCLSWREAVQKILGSQFRDRKLASSIKYGSDCSGLDAPYWGLKYVLSDIEASSWVEIRDLKFEINSTNFTDLSNDYSLQFTVDTSISTANCQLLFCIFLNTIDNWQLTWLDVTFDNCRQMDWSGQLDTGLNWTELSLSPTGFLLE